jgi:hypothetical protein
MVTGNLAYASKSKDTAKLGVEPPTDNQGSDQNQDQSQKKDTPPKEDKKGGGGDICVDVFPPPPGCSELPPKPKPFDCNGGLIDDKGNCIIDGKPPFDCNGGLIDDKGDCVPKTKVPGPDKDCAFNPDGLDKCKPDKDGNCPPGFSHNESNNCFPTGPCPKGFGRLDDDESGKCVKIKISCPPGFEVKKGVCNKDIIINIIKRIKTVQTHVVNGDKVTISKTCYDVLNILWNSKITKGKDKTIDDFVEKCLGPPLNAPVAIVGRR